MSNASLSGEIPDWLRSYLVKEESATEFRVHSPFVVCGLFQTSRYAAAIARSVGLTPPDEEYVERTVRLRKARQQRVRSGELTVIAIQAESSLRLRMDSSAAMAEQMATLIELSHLSNVSIQVMPYEVGQYEALRVGSFTLLSEYGRADPTVHIEGYDGGVLIDGAEEVRRLLAAFEHAQKLALSPTESQQFITRVGQEWDASNA